MRELVKGQLDWHKTVNENFRDVNQTASQALRGLSDKLDKASAEGMKEGYLYQNKDGTTGLREGGGSGIGDEVNAKNVKFADGSDAETNLGAIKGMTSDLNCENEELAASAAGLKRLNDSLNFPDGTHFYPDVQNGVAGYNTDPERGADTFHPFRNGVSSGSVYFKQGTSANFTDIITSLGKKVSDFSSNNFRVVLNSGQIASASHSFDSASTKVATAAVSIGYTYSEGNVVASFSTVQGQQIVNDKRMLTNISTVGGRIVGIVFDPSDTPFAN